MKMIIAVAENLKVKDDYKPKSPSQDDSHSCAWNDTKRMKLGLKDEKDWYIFCVEPTGDNEWLPFVTTGEFTRINGKEYIFPDLDIGPFRRDNSKHFVNPYNSWKIRYYATQPGLPKEVWDEYWPRIKEGFYAAD